MSSRAGFLLSTILFVLTFLACGGDPPDKEIQQARGAVEAARAAGADRYAVEEFNAATEALKNANAAVEQRDYRLALNHALDSLERAQNATNQAVEVKAAARVKAERAIAAATTAVATAVAKVKTAEAAHVPARQLAAANSAIAEARQHVQEARTSFEKEEFLTAVETANGVTAAIAATTEKIDASMPSPVRRRPPST